MRYGPYNMGPTKFPLTCNFSQNNNQKSNQLLSNKSKNAIFLGGISAQQGPAKPKFGYFYRIITATLNFMQLFDQIKLGQNFKNGQRGSTMFAHKYDKVANLSEFIFSRYSR